MNIHIGCENKIGESWINYDITYVAVFEKIPIIGKLIKINNNRYPKEVRFGDISKSLLCEENKADNIYCSHTLEHMTLDDMQNSLQNIYKMLKPNGCFRVIAPDLRTRAENYIKNKDANQFLDSIGMGRKKGNKKFIDKLRNIFGNSIHQWMYDADSMKKYLSNVGFKNIQQCKFGDSGINVFKEVEDKHRFIDENFNFVEVAYQCTK